MYQWIWLSLSYISKSFQAFLFSYEWMPNRLTPWCITCWCLLEKSKKKCAPLAFTIVGDETISMTYKGVAGCEVVRVTDVLAGQELKSLWQATCSWRGRLWLVVSRPDLLIYS
jgi:hypothetical protein